MATAHWSTLEHLNALHYFGPKLLIKYSHDSSLEIVIYKFHYLFQDFHGRAIPDIIIYFRNLKRTRPLSRNPARRRRKTWSHAIRPKVCRHLPVTPMCACFQNCCHKVESAQRHPIQLYLRWTGMLRSCLSLMLSWQNEQIPTATRQNRAQSFPGESSLLAQQMGLNHKRNDHQAPRVRWSDVRNLFTI